MRILAIKAEYPFPPRTGSAIVAFQQLSRLAKDHEVTLVSSGENGSSDEFARILRRSDVLPQLNTSRFYRFIRYCSGMLRGLPLDVSAFESSSMRRHVQRVLDSEKFDAVLLYELTAIQYCPAVHLKSAVANVEDPPSVKLKRMMSLRIWSPAKKLKLLLDYALVRRYERKAVCKVGKALVLSAEDADDWTKDSGLHNISYVPYGISTRDLNAIRPFTSRVQGMIVFSGNMFHPPNVEGIKFFLENVFPLICRNSRTAKLWIVGNKPDARIFEAARPFGDKVVITGGVEELSDYLGKAVVSICPVRLKIGVQTKILEAMSLGTPVVTTPAGNSGIGGQNGHHLWIADQSEAFAERVLSLLSGEKWDEFSAAGRRLVVERFSWDNSVQQLLKQLEKASRG